MRIRFNRKLKIIAAIVVVLIVFRLALPFIVTRYVNNVLSELPGYRGQIDGVDIQLIRGAYQIDSLKIFKVDGHKEIPFIDIPLTDLSVEWDALLHGEVVGEVHFENPVLNFIAGKKTEGKSEGETGGEQSGQDVDWTAPIKKLMPLKINHLTIKEGKVAFYDFTTKPKVDLFLHHVQMDAQNLNNARDNEDILPSRVFLQARSIGNGLLSVYMKINVMKPMPDLDMDMKFENVDLKALNDFFGAYANIDVESGRFNLYTEVAVKDGKISGYVKPLLNNLKVVDWKGDKKKPLQLVWESIAGFVVEVFENQPKNQFATRVSLEGEISSVESSFWPVLWNIFRNAFVEAFDQNTDNTITLASAQEDKASTKASGKSGKTKKELRKEKRDKKREERRARKEEKKDKKKEEKSNP
jgi:hypothetical protein